VRSNQYRHMNAAHSELKDAWLHSALRNTSSFSQLRIFWENVSSEWTDLKDGLLSNIKKIAVEFIQSEIRSYPNWIQTISTVAFESGTVLFVVFIRTILRFMTCFSCGNPTSIDLLFLQKEVQDASSFADVTSSLDKLSRNASVWNNQEWIALRNGLLRSIKQSTADFLDSQILSHPQTIEFRLNKIRTNWKTVFGLNMISNDALAHCIGFVGFIKDVCGIILVSKRFQGLITKQPVMCFPKAYIKLGIHFFPHEYEYEYYEHEFEDQWSLEVSGCELCVHMSRHVRVPEFFVRKSFPLPSRRFRTITLDWRKVGRN